MAEEKAVETTEDGTTEVKNGKTRSQIINDRMVEIQNAIEAGKKNIAEKQQEIKNIEDSIIMQIGATKDCQYWLELEQKASADTNPTKEEAKNG